MPAGFNNIIGLKPTCGHLSTSGVVPACRSIDCVSIFALTADDAGLVLSVAGRYDAADAYARGMPALASMSPAALSVSAASARSVTSTGLVAGAMPAADALAVSGAFRFGVPRADQLEFFGDNEYSRLFAESIARLESLGGERVDIDFAPFRAAAQLLYEGAFIAERYVAVGEFIDSHPDAVHPIARQLIAASRALTAADAFRSQHQLMEAKRAANDAWRDIDVLVTPTTGTIYRIAEVEADPIRLNANLGFYTNFVNFLDLAAVAVPAGFRKDRLPFGVTLVGRAWSERKLLALADRMHRASVTTAGALEAPLPPPRGLTATGQRTVPNSIPVAVCGAHLEGLPLNHQLTSRNATLVRRTRTASAYRFYALPGGPPFRPGLVRVTSGGASIEVEVWSVPAEHFGRFVAGIPAPLGIGKVELEDGSGCQASSAKGTAWKARTKSRRTVVGAPT